MLNDQTDVLKKIAEFLPFIIPIVLLQWSLMVFAIVKLVKAEQPPKLLPKWGWLIVILLVNIIGPVAYLMLGRNEE
ncbi:MAG: PLD nuclease N-terminal domain-containing protein [Saccharofermentanales bacterium]